MKILDALLELLYPSRCAFCRRLTRPGEGMCPACAKTLPFAPEAAQRQSLAHADVCVSPLYYEGDARASLLRYKFRGMAAYAKIYGKILAKCVDGNRISCDIITWAPLGRRRLRRRGYDQAGLLAAALAEETGLPCAPLLKKTRENPAQSGMGGAERRRANVAGLYAVTDPEAARGKKILLVDDIVTTGATLSACAKALKDAGAASVSAAALARRRG